MMIGWTHSVRWKFGNVSSGKVTAKSSHSSMNGTRTLAQLCEHVDGNESTQVPAEVLSQQTCTISPRV